MLVPHLNAAFKKPAHDSRLIFIDLNTREGIDDPPNTPWVQAASERLDEFEKNELPVSESAYLFVTNIAYHRQLDKPPASCVLPFGLGSDFEKPGMFRLGDLHRRKQRHRHAYEILRSFSEDTSIPSTFDGSMPSEAFGGSKRLAIGETYHFTDVDEGGLVATVTSATVDEASSTAYIAVTHQGGGASVLKEQLSPQELADYRSNPDAYFGKLQAVNKNCETPLELFEAFLEAHKSMSRTNILKHLEGHSEYARLALLDAKDLLIEYCEMLVAVIQKNQQKAT
jgi:hypothetical protein